MKVKGGYGYYGYALGILVLDSKFARIPGDVGNATTFDYPVFFKVVEGASGVRTLTGDQTLLEPFIKAAKELEAMGCKAITTSCGFLSMFQKQLAAAVSIPVFTSSLMQCDFVWRMLKPDQVVGIITANSELLGDLHWKQLGIEHVPKVVYGTQGGELQRAFNSAEGDFDVELYRSQILAVAKKMVTEHPEVGAIVLECTNMPPFAADIQQLTGLPVFDFTTMADFVYSALYRYPFSGNM